MDTKWIMTYGLVLIGLFGLSSMAMAVDKTDGNDNIYFTGELITITWTGSQLYNYVWITANEADNASYCVGDSSSGMRIISDNPTKTYVLNTSKNCTKSGIYKIYVNNTGSSTSPLLNTGFENTPLVLNNFTIAVTPDYTKYGVLGGDNATLVITIGGWTDSRVTNSNFVVSTNDTGVTPVLVSSSTTAGTKTYSIPVSGTAGLFNVSVSNGDAKAYGLYATRQLVVSAADRSANTNVSGNVSLKTVDQNGNLANFSTSAGVGGLKFALVLNKTDDGWGGVPGNSTINVTIPVTSNSAVVDVILGTGAAGTGTITASCLNFTKTASTTYTVYGPNENLTMNTYFNGTATTAFNVDQIITVSGWTNDISKAIFVNVTNTTTQLVVVNTTSTNGSWSISVNTSDYPLPNLGTYRLFAWQNGSIGQNATKDITLSATVAITSANSTRNGTVLQNQVYIDDTLVINGTSSRADGKTLTVNVTAGTYSNIQTVSVADGKWGATWTGNSNAATGTGLFKIIVKDGTLTSAEHTITVIDNLAIVSPSVGPIDSTVTIKGTSSRANATTINLNATKDSFQVMTLPATAIVTGNNWTYSWSTTGLPAGTYTVTATDGIVTTTKQITLGEGAISDVAVSSASIYLDDTVNITGSTTYPAGTVVGVNITNCSGGQINWSIATVAADQTFVASFKPADSLANVIAKAGLVAGTPATLCVAINITTTSATTSFQIKDDLALTTVAGAVKGDPVMLTGTSSRANGTTITVNVTYSGLYNVVRYAVVTGQSGNPLTTSTGTFMNNSYWATQINGNSTNEALPAGTYTITATDGVVTATKTLVVGDTGIVDITKPAEGQNISGGPIAIEGTSNRANGTGLNISITGRNQTFMNTMVNASGMFNASWDTTGFLTGVYYITVSKPGAESDVISVIFTATSSTTTTTTTTLPGQTTTTTSTTTTTLSSAGGDANGDGVVNYSDLVILAAAYGKSSGQTGYNAAADFNGDGKVNYADLVILAANYGK